MQDYCRSFFDTEIEIIPNKFLAILLSQRLVIMYSKRLGVCHKQKAISTFQLNQLLPFLWGTLHNYSQEST